jgi:hypothetical protein
MGGHDGSEGAEKAHFWRDADLDGSEFLRARFVSHQFSPHTHDEYVFGLIEAGAETYRYRGSERFAAAGELVIVEPTARVAWPPWPAAPPRWSFAACR